MNGSIIKEKLEAYQSETLEQEVNAIKEIVQEIILYGLSVAGFFEKALFQGGAALRILHGLQRFSEDMDFVLQEPDDNFNWKRYIATIESICEEYGIATTIKDRSQVDSSIARLFIKNDSIGKVIDFSFMDLKNSKVMIKLEIDTNPPAGSLVESKFLDFPLIYAVQAQDLASNFACKCHALLCRPYTKGRDWYDFLWYVSKSVVPNLHLLKNAIDQVGPWHNQSINMSQAWLLSMLREQISMINWDDAKTDVERFLNERDRQQLALWGRTLFMDRVQKLEDHLLNVESL